MLQVRGIEKDAARRARGWRRNFLGESAEIFAKMVEAQGVIRRSSMIPGSCRRRRRWRCGARRKRYGARASNRSGIGYGVIEPAVAAPRSRMSSSPGSGS